MKKENRFFYMSLILVQIALFLFFFYSRGLSLEKIDISETIFLVGIFDISIGGFIYLLNKNYFTLILYGFYYMKETFTKDREEKEHAGVSYQPRKILSPFEYERKREKIRRFFPFICVGVISISISTIVLLSDISN